MKAISSKITRGLPVGARLIVPDNSGAKIVEIISVKNYKGVKRRIASAGIGDLIICAVKSGTPEMRHKIVNCVIIRQKKEIRRPDGTRIKFHDNAAIVLRDVKEGLPKGSVIKGPVAKEVIERWPKIGKIASIVV